MNIIKRLPLLFLIASFITPIFGQAERLRPLPLNAISDIEDANKLFHPRGGEIDWGLALSGGGIRSGSYSIGVMKSLYDHGYFKKIDAISTVSGGGYASYWLYGLSAPGEDDFGKEAFGRQFYLMNTCRLQNNADMYSLWKMIKTIFMKRNNAFSQYRNGIHKTFGHENPDLKLRKIDSYRSAIENGKIPYFFVNTTFFSRDLSSIGKSVEITPHHIGNSVLGYSRWPEGDSMNFLTSITTSAAGMSKVRNEIDNFAPYTVCIKKKANDKDAEDAYGRTSCVSEPIDLWDGGYSENLGALPLIKRGLKNVIIIDAEHDPKYIFDGYFDLKKTLRALDIDLNIPDIDKFLEKPPERMEHATGVMQGDAVNRRSGAHTKIYYIKAMRPRRIFSEIHEAEIMGASSSEREALIAKIYGQGVQAKTKRDENIDKKPGSPFVRCEGAQNTDLDPQMYQFLANKYGYFLMKSKWRFLGRFSRNATYDFPHITTWDQSFFADQMEALIGLGFLQGEFFNELNR